jgi:hypothetical protein
MAIKHEQTTPRRTTQTITTSIPSRRQKLTTGQLQARPTRQFALESAPSRLRRLRNVHWLVLVGVGMLIALVLWMMGSAVLAWGMQRYYDVRYGNPRTYQVDQVVGQDGDSLAHPSHFIAINEHQQVVVIELKAGDPAQAVIYTAPIHNDNGEAPVTLEFRDVTGDGKLDMIVHIHTLPQEQVVVFVNTGEQFRPLRSTDHASSL